MRALCLRLFGVGLVVQFGFSLFSTQPAHAADPSPAPLQGWSDTGITTIGGDSCFDVTQPDTLYTSEEGRGTYTLNFRTGKTSFVSKNTFNTCWQERGLLYNFDWDYDKGILRSVLLFSRADQIGHRLDHAPTFFAHDGSQYAYAIENNTLYTSADGGLSWMNGGSVLPCTAQMSPTYCNPFEVVVSQTDGGAIYKLAVDTSNQYRAALFFSPDAGRTWQKRNFPLLDSDPSYTYTDFGIAPLSGSIASVDTLAFTAHYTVRNPRTSNSYDRYISYLSVDGGRTYNVAGEWYDRYTPPLYVTPKGIFRLGTFGGYGYGDLPILSRSTDGGQSWQPISVSDYLPFGYVKQAGASPSTLFASTDPEASDHPLAISRDSGSTWQEIGEGHLSSFQIAPYVPVTLERFDYTTKHIYIQTPGIDGMGQTASIAASGASGSVYFPQTQHTMSPLFGQYWTEHGGLAQFGYPKTEAFRELNPADNHIYVVQYFERARLEYHPEAPQEYRVLLGLLGNQLIAPRIAKGEGAFNPFPDMHYSGGTYFPQTGHNLRNDFKKYWDAHGGLAIYGYPKSEEFYEVNPDDGKTYVVQYFERNRFEYHPENTGTPYVVLLGLLGNQVLRDKGWLPSAP